MTLQILYLAHDLADAAIRRRVLMLKQGGARVSVAGFQRAGNVLAGEADVPTVVLGRTADARFAQRVSAVMSAALQLKSSLAGLPVPDIIVARNLEMLALAARASALHGPRIPVVYECLDVHRLLLDSRLGGALFRRAEGFFGRHASLLLTSSPAFVENYFRRLSRLKLPTMLVENKVLDLSGEFRTIRPRARMPNVGEPWRIGWFGAIRCRKSLAILTEFAEQMKGRVQIVLRGRPAYGEFDDFNALVRQSPYMKFHGAYRNPEDLAAVYDDVQFVWAIDFFEEGLNSNWLLPNRLYEGSLFGAVPIALSSTETGRVLDRRNLGLTLEKADPQELVRQFEAMDADRYRRLFDEIGNTPRSMWLANADDCSALVTRLAGLTAIPAIQMPPASISSVRS
ncbi:glycosyl transferase family 1 [Pseudorhizobium endolithicum]|uniref:Glycosyl transferase family 1 n=1 Tax=Pseudorhizobium endolithicum TaxID=1191678 RepID=A0ABM8PMS8_9HYPH|nr:glycosyltransferase [Pseudorhizobium endolithicum]CAD7038494.1 glycosyl transferase family 1 [Pseudorhizobium endolithicum]